MDVRPRKGGFLRPFGCGWFIREFLLGHGPEGSKVIDPRLGSPQSDIIFWYKESLSRATARERTERIVSRLILNGLDVNEEDAGKIYERELKRIPRKTSFARYHSFLMYVSVLKRLGWLEVSGKIEPSSIQDNHPPAPNRVYYRLTQKGINAPDKMWANPLFALYPQVGPNHVKNPPS